MDNCFPGINEADNEIIYSVLLHKDMNCKTRIYSALYWMITTWM